MSKDQDTSICFPGEENWELWRQKSGVFELAETAEIEEGAIARPFKSATHFAFPLVAAYAVPVWASSEDKAVVNGVVEMHLEGLGVKPGNPVGQLLDHRVALRKDGRSLVMATVLSEGYELSLPKQSPKQFDISARFLVLPSNHITVWRELGRMVLAVTRDDNIVHFQALSADEIDDEAVREIKCLMLQLSTEGVLENPSGLMLWVDGVDDSVVELATEQLDLRVMRDHRPSPVLPESASKLLPTTVAIQRIDAARRAKIVRIAALAALIWAGFIGWNVWGYLQEKEKASELIRTINRKRPEAEWIPAFEGRYLQVEGAVDLRWFPIDLYQQIHDHVPEKDVRITTFALEGDTLRIEGEARNIKSASVFGGKVFGDDDLEYYGLDWEQRPKTNTKRRDGTVVFSITGTGEERKPTTSSS